MLVPLSWLKEYVEIKLPLKELCSRLTEVGLGVEETIKDKDDYILNIEVTANRPDCLSIIGIAREIAAIENTKIKLPQLSEIKPPKKSLPLKIINDFSLCPRYGGLIIKNVSLKESPPWLKERLIKVGLRPINILVDITNYVMTETGNPLHVFDYDKIKSHLIKYELTHGGEKFTSVDGISYALPKNAIVIKDEKRVIDLCGIKGGLNSGVTPQTKNIFLHVPVYIPHLIRKTSQKLSLHSEASAIFERQADAGAIINVLKRAVQLYLELTDGEIASKIIDLKEKEFNPWTITVNLEKINRVLGIDLKKEEAVSILNRLNLIVETCHGTSLHIKIPTYRNDLHIEEDIIEEIARIYGYNNFPKTMPQTSVPINKIAYRKDYKYDNYFKNLLKSSGYSEIYTYSLISKKNLEDIKYELSKALKITNPVSLDYQYLRPTLLPNLMSAIKENQPRFAVIKIFELGKIYLGEEGKNYQEGYELGVATNEKDGFDKLKGVLEIMLSGLGINFILELPQNNIDNSFAEIHQGPEIIGSLGEVKPEILNNFQIKTPVFVLLLNINKISPLISDNISYKEIPKYPSIIEDITINKPYNIAYDKIAKTISLASDLIDSLELIDRYKDNLTLRLYFQSPKKTLTADEVRKEKEKILHALGKIEVFLCS